MSQSEKKLGLFALTALVVGSMVGGGIFTLPQNMAEGAGAGAILCAWLITFIGMLTLTRIFQWLSIHRADIDDGVYGYAKDGFGEYLGFNAAWGYWVSAWISNTGYLVVMFSALGSFKSLSFFEEGNSLSALIGEVTLLGMMHFFVLSGIRTATILNAIVTVAKLIPVCLFIICVTLAFRIETFSLDFWGSTDLGSIGSQIKKTMLYTVWVFLGIECATVYSSRAKNMHIVSRATLLGFIITIFLLICVSVLSLGIVSQNQLAVMKNPSMAAVIEVVVGPVGAMVINLGVILSVGGAFLAWTLICSEMLYLAARGKNNTAPATFGKLNAKGTPVNALWLSNTLIIILLIVNYYNGSGYNILVQLASSMCLIPYLLCAGCALRIALQPQYKSSFLISLSLAGVIYGTWLIYAGGLSYLLLSMMLYFPGLFFFYRARKERGLKTFSNKYEACCAVIILILALIAGYFMLTNGFSLTG
ncbi:basic amino acid/polyamine antiporter [Klebsiella michiganensis]|uniref:basic amino acid/polyamine antiporter n=1 Tax=Klebsiella michiganensis TaxID=1134687 RepID=UPI00136BC293|nr:basic amino acid/polyamine antiporter [Klebsiella michiganensis]MXJ82337.1 amino acid permease [Klebsiella michiganensis]